MKECKSNTKILASINQEKYFEAIQSLPNKIHLCMYIVRCNGLKCHNLLLYFNAERFNIIRCYIKYDKNHLKK